MITNGFSVYFNNLIIFQIIDFYATTLCKMFLEFLLKLSNVPF